MGTVRTLLSRIAALFRTRRLDASLEDELQAHIDLAMDEHLGRGVPEAEARRLGLLEFGGVTQLRETDREHRGLTLFEQIAARSTLWNVSGVEVAGVRIDRNSNAGPWRWR